MCEVVLLKLEQNFSKLLSEPYRRGTNRGGFYPEDQVIHEATEVQLWETWCWHVHIVVVLQDRRSGP